MKEFNLDAALNGEPVMLRNGDKAFIFKNVLDTPILCFKPDYPLIGMIHNHPVTQTWSLDGRISSCNDCAPGDIVGMWGEPELTSEQVLEKAYQENLPLDAIGKKAFVIAKTKDGDYVMQCGEDNLYFASHETVWEFYKDPEPKSNTITVTLPKPFKPKPNEKFWFIDKVGANLQVSCKIKSNHALTGDGNYFASKADAQAWLGAMRNALDD